MEAQTTWTALRHSLKINYWSDQKQCWVKKERKPQSKLPRLNLDKGRIIRAFKHSSYSDVEVLARILIAVHSIATVIYFGRRGHKEKQEYRLPSVAVPDT